MVKFLPHSLQLLVPWPRFCVKSWNPDMLSLWNTKKYGEKLNNTWMITFYMGILAIFGNFWANICHVHSTCCLSCCIFAWDHCGQIFSFKITQKNCASSEMWWKFLPTTNKNSQIWGKCGISRQILDKLCMINNNINLLISTKRQFNWQVSDIFHFMKQICSSFWVMLF